jgi:hypothetical protein
MDTPFRTGPTGSVRKVREALRLAAAGIHPDDADGTLASHVAELERRAHRVGAYGGAFRHVRLAPGVLAIRPESLATA